VRLLLIDGHYYVYRSYFAILHLSNSRGEPTNAIFGFTKTLRLMLKHLQPELGAVVWDRGIPQRRTELQPDYKVTLDRTPNDPSAGSLWGLDAVSAPTAWNTGTGTGRTIVAVIDSGIAYNHPDLKDNIWRNPGEIAGNGIDDDLNGYVDDVFGIDAVNHDTNPMDDNSHGTHTSGTIAAVGNNGVGVVGVNWNAKVLACKFLNAAGSGSDAGAIECFNYIVALKTRGQNIRVSSNSWGGNRSGPIDQALKDAIDAAGNNGILNVFAAGNFGANNETNPFDPASFSSAFNPNPSSTSRSNANQPVSQLAP